MTQIIHSYDFLLALKAGEVHVLKTRSLEDLPFSQTEVYQQAYSAIQRLNYNQKGKFNAVLRISRDGLSLAAVCTYDGENSAPVPVEYRRKYKPRKRAAKSVAPPKTPEHIKPLSFYMQAYHEGRKVEVFEGGSWRPVQPEDWTTVDNEHFRVRSIRVVVFWDDDTRKDFEFDIGDRRIEALRSEYKNVRVFIEE